MSTQPLIIDGLLAEADATEGMHGIAFETTDQRAAFLAMLREAAQTIEELIGLVHDHSKAPSEPLWWCLDHGLQASFRRSVLGLARGRLESQRRNAYDPFFRMHRGDG